MVATFLMLNSAEHEIFSANKYENANIFSCSTQQSMTYSLLINMKMPTLNSAEHEIFLLKMPAIVYKELMFIY